MYYVIFEKFLGVSSFKTKEKAEARAKELADKYPGCMATVTQAVCSYKVEAEATKTTYAYDEE